VKREKRTCIVENCNQEFSTRAPKRVKCFGCQPKDRVRRPFDYNVKADPARLATGGIIVHPVLMLSFKPAPTLESRRLIQSNNS